MTDIGTPTCDVIVKIEGEQEPVGGDEHEDNKMCLEQSIIKKEEICNDPEVEYVAYGAMQNEEVLPDSFPTPVGSPVPIIEETCEEPPSTSGTTVPVTAVDVSSPDDMAETRTCVPNNSISGANMNDVPKPPPELLAHLGSIFCQENKDQLQFRKFNQVSELNSPNSASPPQTLMPVVPSTITDSLSSSNASLHAIHADSSTSLPTSSEMSRTSPMPASDIASNSSTDLLSMAASSSSASFTSLSSSSAVASTLTSSAQDSHGIVKSGKRKTKRCCPEEALNVVQDVLLNPTPFHVYHLHSLATFMAGQMHDMDARKRKRVENRLMQLILEEDM